MAVITRTSDSDRERLRRQAVSRDQGPSDEQQAAAYPARDELERLGLPPDPNKPSFALLRRMRRDHTIALGMHLTQTPVIAAPFYYEADDARAAAFADNLIRPIYGDLVLLILRFLWAGFSPGVKNMEVVQDPSWTYLPGIDQDPQKVWTQSGVGALVYRSVKPLRPENSKPTWDAQGNFNGIKYDGRYGGPGVFVIDGQRTPDIDLLHSIWATQDRVAEDGNPFGYARLAYCAPIYHMFQYIWTLLGRAFENNADPGPIVRFPRDDPDEIDENGNIVKPVDTALTLGRRKRSGSTIALPSDVYQDFQNKITSIYKWSFDYPKIETNFEYILNFLGVLESLKLRALLIQDLGVIESSGSQSNRNVVAEMGTQRNDSQIGLMKQVDEVIDKVFIKPAMAMNMPWYEGKLVKKNIGFGSTEEEIVRQLLQLAGQQDFRTFGVDVRKIMEAEGAPMLSPADYRLVQQQIAADASAAPTPAVTPTQGRRALVTQTGFDRETEQPIMSYVQLDGSIELAGDDDFVTSLPKTDVFSDSRVVAATRSLRTDSKAFITWAYTDFARYLGKQRSLDLQAEVAALDSEHLTQAGEELADGEKVRKLVDKIMSGWRPSAEKIGSFSKSARSSLGRVFDRVSAAQLERVRSKSKLSSIDEDAATWLDEAGAEMVTSVLQTTREQLATVLAVGVREGKQPREIADDIRSHFEDFPASRASAIARTEVGSAYNYATVRAGMVAGVSRAQLVDGEVDKPCKDRNGKIVTLEQAAKQRLAHPNCSLFVRLLPGTSSLEVRREPLDGLLARYDPDTETVLLSPDLPADRQAEYLLALGGRLAVAPQQSGE